MNTNEGGTPPENPFTAAELAQAAEAPAVDPELDEVVPAEIDAAESVEPVENLAMKSRRLEPDRVRAVVESLLFVAEAPLTVEQLKATTHVRKDALVTALAELAERYAEGKGGLLLQEVGGGWQFRTDPACADYVRRFLQVKPQRLTRAALETLSIIAYRQPVTRPEVEDVRGVDSGAVIKALLERRLVKILGKKEEIGRPILYGTSREFLEFFSLRDLGSLPTLREFQELSKEHQEIVEKEAPAPAPVPTLESLADPGFRATLDASQEDAEEALGLLEDAISTADQRAKRTQATLAPPAVEPAPQVAPVPAELPKE